MSNVKRCYIPIPALFASLRYHVNLSILYSVIVLTFLQIASANAVTVDYWGLDATTDWRALNTFTANVSKLFITLEMTNFDEQDDKDDEFRQVVVLRKQV